MAKITVNPRFAWSEARQRYVLSSHDGQYEIPDNEVLIRCDRGVQKAAGNLSKQASATGNQFGSRGTDIYNSIIPGLESDATHPTGFTPLEKSSMLTSSAESLGGVNSGAGGEARLNQMRTRNASGFAPALAEAARAKGRAQATNTLGINMADAQLARQKQEQARQQLEGLYGVNTSDMLKSMGLADQDLQTQLEAGKSGWYQNLLGGLNTAANLRKAFSPGGGGGGQGGGGGGG